MNEQEIYGMIISGGIEGRILDIKGYSYADLLVNKNNAYQTIAQYKDEIQTHVTDEALQKAIKKENKLKKVKGQDIAKSTIELTITGNGGSQVCDDVQTDYKRLMTEKAKRNEREGSDLDVSN